MKTFKKLFAYSAIFALLATMMPTYANAASYDAELTEAYAYAKNKWITTMTSIDNADMYGNLTRVAMAKMVANYVLDLGLQELDTDKECNFPDVSASLDEAYDNGVTKACQLGLMGVGIEKFNPNGIVTRAEFGTVLSRALWGDEYNGADPYYKDHLQALKDEGIMNIIDNPNMKEVRGYVMLMMMRADDAYTPTTGCSAEELLACIVADDYDACIAACSEDAEEEVLPGYATVSTKAAAAQTVALNAVDKKVWTVTLKAGENDTTVTSIEITKSWLWERADILNVQLMKNWEYVSNAATLTAKKTATLRFSPKLEIKAGKSETFDVVVSMAWSWAATPNGQHEFSVTAVTVVNGTFWGTPAKLGSLTTTNYTVWTVTAKLAGELTTSTLAKATPSYTLNAWDKNVDIASVNIKPASESVITAITLTSEWDELDKTFANVKAYIDDEVVWNVTVNDETIIINWLNETVKANKSIDVVLKWDVIFVWNTADKVLYIDTNHVTATEVNTNERMASAKSKFADTKVSGVDLTLKNLTKKDQKVAPETSDVVLLDLELSAGADLEVTDYYVKFAALPTWTEYEDSQLTLYVDWVNYDIKATSPELIGTTFNITNKKDSFVVNAGDKISIQVVWDANDTASTAVNAIEFWINAVKKDNKTIPWAPTLVKEDWHKTTYAAWDITVKSTKKGSNNLIEEWTTSDVLSFSVKANNEKVTVKEVNVDLTVAAAADFDSVDSIALYKSGSSSPLATIDNDEFDDTSAPVYSGKFTISQPINVDATESYVIKAKMDDGTVTSLGKSYKFDLKNIVYRPSSASTNAAPKTTTLTATYKMSSSKPTFSLTKDWKDIIVEINNASEYDLVKDTTNGYISFKLEVIWVFIDGADLLKAALNSNTWKVKDDMDNAIAWATATYAGNTLTVSLPATFTVDSNVPETIVIEMDQKTKIESNYYTVEEKAINFAYSDWTSTSADIAATY